MIEIQEVVADLIVKDDTAKLPWKLTDKNLLYRRILQLIKTDPTTIFPKEECYHPEGDSSKLSLTLNWGPKLYAAVH